LARADDPAHLIVVDALASRARQLVGARLVLIIEEVAFVERHVKIILLFDYADRLRACTYLPQRASGSRSPRNSRVPADPPAAGRQPARVDRIGEPRAGRGSPALSRAAEHRSRRP